MKKTITSILFFLCSLFIIGQVPPQAFNYSSVIRGNDGQALPNKDVSLRLTIISGSSTGTEVYQETHFTTTSQIGVINLEIGHGTVVSGVFSEINWGADNYYLQIELDDDGGSDYQMMGTAQFLSVPYALYCGNGVGSDSSSTDELQTISISNDTIFLTSGGFIELPRPQFYVGKDTLGGIVFFVYEINGQQHGLIVSKTESTAQWQNPISLVNANRTDDGAYNTNLLTNSPAKIWVESLGAGWYLPSIDELSLLWHNRFLVNKSLREGSYTLLPAKSVYWTSTEDLLESAFRFDVAGGHGAYSSQKTDVFSVRAVRMF
ncbi:MAG: hypothetical protein A2W91_00725 [Bacteroidetes bacterium GWF2_38_335]|nr:MAG: hypothetical protein A2W91_00725 [Bacteroidetes bacterium GWF2_38_335]OFY78356.1 MAG: hypothetical protein A2281_04105 [Bacteroidetes bacterium RIFOXYA12_FULL_38_20]HBS87447.1 hypothetical protein [Bacteroidales bacterium]